MVSFQAHLLSWTLWFTRKGSFQSAASLHKHIDRQRKVQDHRPPEKLRTSFIIEERQVGGFPVYEVSPKSETPSKARILYLHGGAFVFELSQPHWNYVTLLAERLQAIVTFPVYPLGPDYKLADMYAMLQPIHDELAAASDDTPLFVMGDSAGGTMSLVLTQEAIKADKPTASRIVAITPAIDSTLKNPEMHAVAARDPWLDIPGCDEAMNLVCGDWARDDPRVSPIYGEVDKLPPTMVFTASEDFLAPDARLFVEKLRAAGREVVSVEGEGLMHVWPLLPIPEGRAETERIVGWLGEAIEGK